MTNTLVCYTLYLLSLLFNMARGGKLLLQLILNYLKNPEFTYGNNLR
jgi:hypothetical protein